MKTSSLFLTLALAGMMFASCSENIAGTDDDTTTFVTIDEKSAEVAALCGTCNFTGTLTEAFRSFSVPDNQMKELALINNLELTDQVQQGKLIKIIGE